MSDDGKWIHIEREFDTSADVVWSMWTDPELFRQWYGPKGMNIPVAQMDITIGGTRKICMEMTMPDRTMSMWFTGQYKDITPPNRLVYTESMCDPDGNIISPSAMGMPEGTPDMTEVVVEITDLGGKTRMEMTHVGIPAGTPGEGGWNQAFDKLGDFIAKSAA